MRMSAPTYRAALARIAAENKAAIGHLAYLSHAANRPHRRGSKGRLVRSVLLCLEPSAAPGKQYQRLFFSLLGRHPFHPQTGLREPPSTDTQFLLWSICTAFIWFLWTRPPDQFPFSFPNLVILLMCLLLLHLRVPLVDQRNPPNRESGRKEQRPYRTRRVEHNARSGRVRRHPRSRDKHSKGGS